VVVERGRPVVLIVISLLCGLLIAVFPLSQEAAYLRPEIVCMLVVYWVMHSPQHIGMLFAWSAGLVQDVVEVTVWGAHALALTVLAYICLLSYQRIRNYSVWHQSLWIFVLVGTHQVVVNWIQGLAGYRSPAQLLILPTVMSALCWPLLVFVIQRIRQRYRLA